MCRSPSSCPLGNSIIYSRTVDVFGLPKTFLISFVVCAAVFILFPQIDIQVTQSFFDPVSKFKFNYPLPVVFIYRSVEVLAVAVVASLIILLPVTLIRKKPVFSLSSKKIIYLLLVLIIGPALIVNVVFKDHWGRARPDDIKAFGGKLEFTPAFVISDQCSGNCSFVSGHASLGFYLVSLGFIVARHRKKVFALTMSYGAVVGFVRIYQGRHFLSDVVFSFFFVYMTAGVLHYLMFQRTSCPPKNC